MTGDVDPQALVPIEPAWSLPVIHVERLVGAPRHLSEDRLSADSAEVSLLHDEVATFDRASGRAVLHTPRRDDDGTLVHPFLASAASVFAYWLGDEAFHGGAALIDGRVIMLLGENGAGKSSLLGALALTGQPILADDLVVMRGGRVFAGPPWVDLRPGALDGLQVNVPTSRVRSGDRFRLRSPNGPVAAPLAGWVLLKEGADVEVRALTPSDRLVTLTKHRTVSLVGLRPAVLLGLAALPGYLLTRPLRWDAMPLVQDVLRGLLAR